MPGPSLPSPTSPKKLLDRQAQSDLPGPNCLTTLLLKSLVNSQKTPSKSEMETEALTGKLVVEKVRGKSTVTRSFSRYPLKFFIPNKVFNLFFSPFLFPHVFIFTWLHCWPGNVTGSLQVGSSETDAVWIYTLTYGGGIVSVCYISSSLFWLAALQVLIF